MEKEIEKGNESIPRAGRQATFLLVGLIKRERCFKNPAVYLYKQLRQVCSLSGGMINIPSIFYRRDWHVSDAEDTSLQKTAF